MHSTDDEAKEDFYDEAKEDFYLPIKKKHEIKSEIKEENYCNRNAEQN